MGWADQKKSLQTCLLLLLRDRGADADALVERVRPLLEVPEETVRVRRSLRQLERQGLVRSSWHPSNLGPATCTYRITSKGLVRLAQQAEVLAALLDRVHAFLELYARATGHAWEEEVVTAGSLVTGSRHW